MFSRRVSVCIPGDVCQCASPGMHTVSGSILGCALSMYSVEQRDCCLMYSCSNYYTQQQRTKMSMRVHPRASESMSEDVRGGA